MATKSTLLSVIYSLFVACALATVVYPATPVVAAGDVSAALRRQLAQTTAPAGITAKDWDILRTLYAERDYEPIWVSGVPGTSRTKAVAEVVQSADREGLRPQSYEDGRLAALHGAQDADGRAAQDIAVSELVRAFIGDLRHGRKIPRQADPKLFIHPTATDDLALLRRAAGAPDIRTILRDQAPSNPIYRRLRRALAALRHIAEGGGWPALPAGETLKPGSVDPLVPALRRRLEISGDISPTSTLEPELYDPALAGAVQRFQARHGLEADGQVGPKTLAALNVSADDRIEQIVINMERWRWMPDDLGERYVLVNLAAFELDYVEDGVGVLTMRVVVGKPYRRSPVFSDRIRYLEVNPYWTVPPSIARKDILPKVQKDPGHLRAQGFRVFDGWGDNARQIDPASVDWISVNTSPSSYKLRQDPGPLNALGRIKFMFPNSHNVYLHDTPSRDLFARTDRTFSSGCIRLEHPLELAAHLLAGQQPWNRARLDAAIQSGKTQQIILERPVPVYLTYTTTWIGEGGTIHFRSDVYGRDKLLRDALARAQ